MRVQVPAGPWDQPSAYDDLQRLLARALTGQHEIFVDDPEKVLTSSFSTTAVAQKDQVGWTEGINRTLGAARNSPEPQHQAVVTIGGCFETTQKGYRVPIESLGEWAEESLMVLLENDVDWLLVEWAARLPGQGKSALKSAIENRWLKPNGRGGSGEVFKSIEKLPQHRVVAVLDSDRDEWNAEPSNSEKVNEARERNAVPIHVLRARELENYVPEADWWSVVGSGGKSNRAAQTRALKEAREAQLWGEVRSFLKREAENFTLKRGKTAYSTVFGQVNTKANRKITKASRRQLLEERQRMSPEERAVDDLKARLGTKITDELIRQARETLDLRRRDRLDRIIVEDLKTLEEILLEWL